MKARPILFNGDMVRAILDGRKTQTRRVIKPQPHDIADRSSEEVNAAWQEGFIPVKCPFGKVGDLLWVRESFNLVTYDELHPRESPNPMEQMKGYMNNHLVFAAGGVTYHPIHGKARWKPSIHMPRWASRITLEITGVCVERLQDISEDDALAEGLWTGVWGEDGYWVSVGEPDFENESNVHYDEYGHNGIHPEIRAYRQLWESINGLKSWDANPWVRVIEFKPHMMNVDALLAQNIGEY